MATLKPMISTLTQSSPSGLLVNPLSMPVKGVDDVGPTGLALGQKRRAEASESMTYNRLFGLKPYNTKIKQISCSKFLKTVQYLIGHREFA